MIKQITSPQANTLIRCAQSNIEFCYWLQGHYEIGQDNRLSQKLICAMLFELSHIAEPLGPFTQWLAKVLLYIVAHDFQQEHLTRFAPLIESHLNDVFMHVIDNSYDTTYSQQALNNIHQSGKALGGES